MLTHTYLQYRYNLTPSVVCSSVKFLVALLCHTQGYWHQGQTLKSATSCAPVNYFKTLVGVPP